MNRDLAKIDTIIVHCADVNNGRVTTAEEIDGWHKQKGFRRAARDVARHQPHLKYIGYHSVIYTTGIVVVGRDLTELGATAKGWNMRSVGVCLIGRDQYTQEQWDALRSQVLSLRKFLRPDLKIIGHRDANPDKTCPGFDVAAWVANDLQALPDHLLQKAA